MKHFRIYLAITALVLASLACNALSRNRNTSSDSGNPAATQAPGDSTQPTPASDTGGSGNSVDTDFVMTADAYNVVDVGDGSLLFYTKMSQSDLLQFYRDEYTAKGYTERELLTTVSDGVFSIVFDGDPSGKALVIQSVDLGDGSCTVAIRLEDV